MKTNTQILAASILAVAILIASAVYYSKPTIQSSGIGSVAQGSEMIATTTSANFVAPRLWNLTPFSSTSPQVGVLGNYTVTKAGSAGGNVNFYDATTTSVLERAEATSSILIASFPTDLAAGTYHIDGRFYRGLIVVTDGTVGTSTVSGRW